MIENEKFVNATELLHRREDELKRLREAFGMFLNGMAYHDTFPDNDADARQLQKQATYNFLRARNNIGNALAAECLEAAKAVYAAEAQPEIERIIDNAFNNHKVGE